MINAKGPRVLEFNARFGDPETQVILPRLQTDLVDIIEAILEGRLAKQPVEWRPEAAVCVVLAAEGYPGDYPKGRVIQGLKEAAAAGLVFHAGTALDGEQVVTSGGRVLGVTALGADIRAAIDAAYQTVAKISFAGCQYRSDIGYRALQRQNNSK